MKLFSPLFWRLYLSIIGTLILAAVIFLGTSLYIDRATAISHFHADTTFVSYNILKEWNENQTVSPQHLETLQQEHFFDIQITNNAGVQKATEGYEFVKDIENTRIFKTPDYMFLSARPLPGSDKWLLIADIAFDDEMLAATEEDIALEEELAAEFELMEEEEDYIFTAILFALGGVLLLLAVVLLFQVKTISKHIDNLTAASVKWGRGNLKARANEEAPRPLNGLAQSLNKMAQSLHQSNKEQQVMVHAISHELRTPLSKLELALPLLRKKYKDLADEPIIDDLSSYMDELSGLANQVLTYSKLRHRVEKQTNKNLNFSELVKNRSEQLAAMHQEKSVDMEIADNVAITGETFYLQMLVDNIVSNALKFANSRVAISLTEDNGTIFLQVNDDGPGISPTLREQVFLPFFRIDESRTKDTGGFGLGLAIADTIIQQYQGKITLGDHEAEGLSVTVTLPVAAINGQDIATAA